LQALSFFMILSAWH